MWWSRNLTSHGLMSWTALGNWPFAPALLSLHLCSITRTVSPTNVLPVLSCLTARCWVWEFWRGLKRSMINWVARKGLKCCHNPDWPVECWVNVSAVKSEAGHSSGSWDVVFCTLHRWVSLRAWWVDEAQRGSQGTYSPHSSGLPSVICLPY